MIFACQVVRKHLIINKEYKLQLGEDNITIGIEVFNFFIRMYTLPSIISKSISRIESVGK